MARNAIIGWAMLASAALFSASALAAEPSLHQVYQAAEAGRMVEAENMMHQVLQAHPNSGKAHYVEAELLARQGKIDNARSELANAERLAPGLPFATPQAVASLKALSSPSTTNRPVEPTHFQAATPATEQPSFPWGMFVVGFGLVALVIFAIRFMAQRNGSAAYNGGFPSGNPNRSPQTPYGPQAYSAGGIGAMGGTAEPGLGSRVMSGLATGAAVGAGVVAGEALMHHFTDGNRSNNLRNDSFGDIGPSSARGKTEDNDMGGADFGISDTSSWDDSSDSGSDWN